MFYSPLDETKLNDLLSAIYDYLMTHIDIMVSDQENNIVFINESMARHMAVAPNQLFKTKATELVKAGMCSHSAMGMTIATEEPQGTISRSPDGTLGFAIGDIIRDNNGSIKYAISTGTSVIRLIKQIQMLLDSPIQSPQLVQLAKKINNQYVPIYFKSDAMFKIVKQAERLSYYDANVLITGESGVGKDVIANYIYRKSRRSNKPIVPVLIPAIPDTLLEAELFGYEPGAFTNASKDGKTGLLEAANGGTVLLDEVGDIPLPTQVKLLRFIETKEFFKVGGTKPIHLDVQIISTTNKDLKAMIKKGLFREDLYYRINTLSINIPPLRERPDDIQPLADHFLRNLNQTYMTNKQISPQAYEILKGGYWEGNSRELRNVIEKMFVEIQEDFWSAESVESFVQISHKARIKVDSAQEILWTENNDKGQSFVKSALKKLDDDEEYRISQALIQAKGNKKRAAEIYGCSQATFYRKLSKYKD